MYQDVVRDLAQIKVAPSGAFFSDWKALGINHGFEGIAGQSKSVHHLRQVHGNTCIEVSDLTKWEASERSEGDGIFSSSPGAIAVKTADCVPILLYHPQMVMALHGGWKGLCNGIIEEGLRKIPIEGLLVGIGPHISTHSFEIGSDVREKIEASTNLDDIQKSWVFSRGINDRWHCDLGLTTVFILINNGIPAHSISLMRTCTKMNSEEWHSYRRDREQSGRNWSWISL